MNDIDVRGMKVKDIWKYINYEYDAKRYMMRAIGNAGIIGMMISVGICLIKSFIMISKYTFMFRIFYWNFISYAYVFVIFGFMIYIGYRQTKMNRPRKPIIAYQIQAKIKREQLEDEL